MKSLGGWRKNFPQIFSSPKVDFFHNYGKVKGLGCIALHDIEGGELLLSVPYADCVWPHVGWDESEIGLLTQVSQSLSAEDRFTEYLQSAVEAASSSMQRIAQETFSSFENMYRLSVEPLLAKFDERIVALLLSRCFASDHGSIAAVPLADQFNHSTLHWNTRIREDVEKRVFYFIAERKIFKNDEILNNYGINNVVEMFVTHGFVDAGLCDSVIVFPTALMKETFSGLIDHDDVLISVDVSGDSVIPASLLAAIPMDYFVPALVDGLVRAMDRMVASMEGKSQHPIVRKDLENCQTYKQRLLEFRLSLYPRLFAFMYTME